jgi:hypothetical protein
VFDDLDNDGTTNSAPDADHGYSPLNCLASKFSFKLKVLLRIKAWLVSRESDAVTSIDFDFVLHNGKVAATIVDFRVPQFLRAAGVFGLGRLWRPPPPASSHTRAGRVNSRPPIVRKPQSIQVRGAGLAIRRTRLSCCIGCEAHQHVR